jgi:hypothetical protein
MKIFVAYPYALAGYRDALAKSLAAPDFELLYADEHLADDHVLRKIEDMLASCDLGLFDVTGGNPNVTLELGIAIAAPHPYVVAVQNDAVGKLGADIHGWDQLRYQTVEELGSKLRGFIDRRRVPVRRVPVALAKAKLWLFTERQHKIAGGPSMLELYATVSNEGDATANGFTVRFYWHPDRAQRQAPRDWERGGTFAVPFFERHFDTAVYPGATSTIPTIQIATGNQGFGTDEIYWSISYADGQLPEERGLFMPLSTAARSEENEKEPFRPS